MDHGLFVGTPWLALSLVQALFPAVFGVLAVAVRRLPGWPLWFAAEWAVQEWLKSSVPFGGFPWGVVAFSQDDGPLLPLAQLGGRRWCRSRWRCRVQPGGHEPGDRDVVAAREPREAARAGGGAARRVHLRGPAGHRLDLAAGAAGRAGADDDPSVTVAAVQGNVPRLGLDFNAQRRAVLDNHVNETLRLAEDVRAGRAPQPMV